MNLPCNVGGTERTVRLVSGALLVPVALFSRWPSPVKWLAMAVGATEVTTALTRYCPINQLIGRNTCREG